MEDLAHLLRTAADGDRNALRELVGETQPDVYRFCTHLVGPQRAEDATQETFIRAWRSARSFRAESSVRTWLLAIARRVCADQLDKQRRTDEVTERLRRRRETADDPVDALGLRELVDALVPERRTPFVLTQLHGLSYEETAEVCGCPVGTVRSRIARARADLIAAYRAAEHPAAGDQEG